MMNKFFNNKTMLTLFVSVILVLGLFCSCLIDRWNDLIPEKEADLSDVLCFTVVEKDSSVSLSVPSGDVDYSVIYSKDGTNWYDANSVKLDNLSAGDKVYFKAGTSTASTNKSFKSLLGESKYDFVKESSFHFTMTGKISASGNIMYLVDETGKTNSVPEDVFNGLFEDCKALISAPDLPATTLTDGCYKGMFSGCSSLVSGPVLPATSLATACYESMFKDCTALKTVSVACSKCDNSFMKNWLDGISSSITLICLNDFDTTSIAATVPESLTVNVVQDVEGMFCFTATQDGSSVQLNIPIWFNSEKTIPSIYYSSDGASWSTYNFELDYGMGYTGMIIGLNKKGDKVYFRGTSGYLSDSKTAFLQFSISGEVAASGNIMYLFDESGNTDTALPYCFYSLFKDCTCLTKAPELSATTLAKSCYEDIFSGCTALISGPTILPGKALKTDCYKNMFTGCTAMVNGPAEISATELYESCYEGMFSTCTALVSAPELPATTLANSCYKEMFKGCTSLKTGPSILPGKALKTDCYKDMFTNCTSMVNGPSEISATELYANCYEGMFSTCTALVTAPNLPAMELVEGCYKEMFKGCTSLKTGPSILPATALKTDCYKDMFKGCTAMVNGPAEISATELYESCYEGLFSGCTSLVSAPKLPAVELVKGCYKEMFKGCIALKNVNTLTATTLAESCYEGMFNGCAALESAPKLSAVELVKGCCKEMFKDCIGLKNVNTLTATTLAESCYEGMFNGCTALESAPELPETDLKKGCYKEMFKGCKGLKNLNSLPATTLAESCYEGMFSGCILLTKVPSLTAETLAKRCYANMFEDCTSLFNAPDLIFDSGYSFEEGCFDSIFKGCSKLSFVRLSFTAWPDSSYATSSFSNWIPAATESYIISDSLSKSTDYMPQGWNVITETVYKEKYVPLCFSATGNKKVSIKLIKEGSPDDISILYSYNNKDWSSYTLSDPLEIDPSVVDKKNVYFKTEVANHFSESENDYYHFTMTSDGEGGSVKINGDITYLVDPDGDTYSLSDYSFYSLFKDCKVLTVAPDLPALSVGDYCYKYMFKGCSSLVSMPNMLFTSLGEYACEGMFEICTSLNQTKALAVISKGCYQSMFSGCTALITAPDLPAATLAESCYKEMFKDCTSLKTGPSILPAKTLKTDCYKDMFTNCTAMVNGPSEISATELYASCYEGMFSTCVALVTAPNLPATTLAESCYKEMFKGCIALKNVNTLSATTLAANCYEGMFSGCKALVSAPNLAATTLAPSCCKEMFKGCIALKNVNTLPAKILAANCYESMFSACTGLTEAPSIMATTLAANCCESMFSGCTSLVDVSILFANELETECYKSMFYGCTSLVVGPAILATTFAEESESCCEGMFNGCTALTDISTLMPKTLAKNCYKSMFEGCTALVASPIINATTLAEGCCDSMFKGCTNLVYVCELKATTLVTDCYDNMFNDCKKLRIINADFSAFVSGATDTWLEGAGIETSNFFFVGTSSFYSNGRSYTASTSTLPNNWTVINEDEGLWFIPETSGKVKMNLNLGVSATYRLYNGTDGTYSTPTNVSSGTDIDVNKGSAICFNGSNGKLNSSSTKKTYFTLSGKFEAFGDVVKLIKMENISSLDTYIFAKLFDSCATLTRAPKIGLTNCYKQECYYMFNGCTGLVYGSDISSITNAGQASFNYAYSGCSSLKRVYFPDAVIYGKQGCAYMLYNCTGLKIVTIPKATFSAAQSYQYMFKDCTGLKTVVLNDTSLTTNSYQNMFYHNNKNTSSLKYIYVSFSAWGYSADWLKNVSNKDVSNPVFYCPQNLSNPSSNIPEGWTIITY